jgi:glycosyltransferase involved in cell wall biosynthesis
LNPSGKIRVLITGADRIVGGIPFYVNTIVEHADQLRFEFHVVVTPESRIPSPVAPTFPGATLHELEFQYGPLSFLNRIVALRRLMLDQGIDVIHAHASRAGLIAALATLGLKVRFVYTGHSWRSQQLTDSIKRRFVQLSERIISSRATVLTYLSTSEKKYGDARYHIGEKGILIRTRIDGDRFANISAAAVQAMRDELRLPEDAQVLGMIGRLEWEKNPKAFFEIGFRLMEKFPRLHVVWLGDGVLKAELQTMVNASGFADRVRLPGAVAREKVPGALKCFDVLLCTSRYEAMPISFLEAQAACVPIVSAAFESVGDVIENGVTGFVFGQDDTNDAIDRLSYLFSSQNYSVEIVEVAKLHFDRIYSGTRQFASEFEKLYSLSFIDRRV